MKKILAFAGSNSSTSINHQLILSTVNLISEYTIEIIELRNYSAPIYSKDHEQEFGFLVKMIELNHLFNKADGFIIALPEYNSGVTPVFKNVVDWISRIERPIFRNKPVLLMATSEGKRGGITNLTHVESLMPRWGGNVTATFSLPEFNLNLDPEKNEITNSDLKDQLELALKGFTAKLVD